MKHILKSVYASYIRNVLIVGLFSALLVVEAQAVGPDITCNSDPVIFNTGYDGMGGKLAVALQTLSGKQVSGMLVAQLA